MVIPAEKFEISLKATNVATMEPVSGSANGYCIKNEEYFFKVIAEPEVTPVVFANDTLLTPNENGNQITPDLILVGFGVNDRAGKRTAEDFKTNMKAIVDKARTSTGNAKMEVLYYSPFIPNQLTDTWDIELLLEYEKALEELAEADENTGVVKLTSIFAEIIKCKAPEDYISAYWNHGNDFTARIYATGILEAMLGLI